MKIFNGISLTITIILGVGGMIITIVAPWVSPWIAEKSPWIAEKLSMPLMVAKFVGIVCIAVVVSVIILAIFRRVRVGTGHHPPNYLVNGLVPEEAVYQWLLSTLLAFQNSLASRFRELHNEHELTRNNRRYHRDKVCKLIEMGLLDCEASWLRYSGSAPEWRPHLIERKEIDRDLRQIYNILCWRFKSPAYSITLAGRETQTLLQRVARASKKLRDDEQNLLKKVKS